MDRKLKTATTTLGVLAGVLAVGATLYAVRTKKEIFRKWIKSKNTGDKIRLMSTKNLKKIGQKNKFNLKWGIKDTIEWYKLNQKNHKKKYNSFIEKFK